MALTVTAKHRRKPLYACGVHETAVKDVHAVVMQASVIPIDTVGVELVPEKPRPLMVMMPPVEIAVLIGSLTLSTGAANPTSPKVRRAERVAGEGDVTAKYRRS
jgi:hypothetical protein